MPAAQPLPQAFASPVPTHRVLPEASLGSRVIEPMALAMKGPDTKRHTGVPDNALSVRQMPPPDAPA